MKHLLYILFSLAPLALSAQTVLTLDQCISEALQHNTTLQNAALDIEMAKEQRKEAFTKYFPEIQANVMAFRAFDEMVTGDGTIPMEVAMINPALAPMIGMPYSYSEFNRAYSVMGSLTQPLFAGGQIYNGNKLAQLQEEVMRLQLSMKEKEVRQKVTECYWQIATVQYNLNTIEAAEKQLTTVLGQVEQYVKAGVTTQNDLLRVRLRQQELASNRLKLENAERVLLMLLAQQIGRGNEPIAIQPTALQTTSPMSFYKPSADAAQGRVELQLANQGVKAGQYQLKMERGKLLPTLAVGLMGFHTGFGGLSDNVKNYMNTTMNNGMVFGTLSVPVTAWWGGAHAIKRQKIKLQQAENDAKNALEMLTIDIESSWSNLTEAYKQIEIAESSVEQAAENLRMTTQQYKMGTITLSELLDAETINRQAQNSLSESRANYFIRLAEYREKTN